MEETKNWFDATCYYGKNQLVAFAPSDKFKNSSEYIDIAIRDMKGVQNTITVKRTALHNFLNVIHSCIPKSDSGEIPLSCVCEKSRCKKQFIFTYVDKKLVKLHIKNSKHEESIFITKDEIQKFCEKFKT